MFLDFYYFNMAQRDFLDRSLLRLEKKCRENFPGPGISHPLKFPILYQVFLVLRKQRELPPGAFQKPAASPPKKQNKKCLPKQSIQLQNQPTK